MIREFIANQKSGNANGCPVRMSGSENQTDLTRIEQTGNSENYFDSSVRRL